MNKWPTYCSRFHASQRGSGDIGFGIFAPWRFLSQKGWGHSMSKVLIFHEWGAHTEEHSKKQQWWSRSTKIMRVRNVFSGLKGASARENDAYHEYRSLNDEDRTKNILFNTIYLWVIHSRCVSWKKEEILSIVIIPSGHFVADKRSQVILAAKRRACRCVASTRIAISKFLDTKISRKLH